MKDKSPPSSQKFDRKAMAEAAEMLQQHRAGVVLTGRVKNGKVTLDKAALEAISRKFPDAEFSFVAVNAPFDPVSREV